jgi:hypothetical protein
MPEMRSGSGRCGVANGSETETVAQPDKNNPDAAISIGAIRQLTSAQSAYRRAA